MSPPELPARPGDKAVTLKDIARALGISTSVVSRALRDSPRVSPAMRQRAQALAAQMGYQPNAMAAGLAHLKQTSRTTPIHAALAWVNLWPNRQDLHNFHEFDFYWQGARRAAAGFGYRLEEFHIGAPLTTQRLQSILLARNIRGLLIPPAPQEHLRIDWSGFNWDEFSVVRFGRSTDDLPPFQMVTSAQAANAALALVKMRERGYTRIGYVGLKTEMSAYLGGFLQAQRVRLPENERVPPMLLADDEPPVAAVPGPSDPSRHLEAFRAWFKKWKPDAILTDSPAISSLLKKGVKRAPESLGLAALNVLDTPPIDAGMHQQPEEIGRVATLLMISLINDQSRGIPPIQREILVRGEWVDGKSLPRRPPPGAAAKTAGRPAGPVGRGPAAEPG